MATEPSYGVVDSIGGGHELERLRSGDCVAIDGRHPIIMSNSLPIHLTFIEKNRTNLEETVIIAISLA